VGAHDRADVDRITAQLSLTTINADMRTLLERGRLVLSRLSRDGAALPTDPMGLRWKPTFYARRLTLGRLTAGASSMQPMPNLLRQWLYRGILHDIDFVNAHPTIMLGLAMTLRPNSWRRDVPRLASYATDRNALLKDIVHWYGLPGDDFAKTAILVVSNNGELKYWRRRVKSPVSPIKPDLPALVELQREVLWLRGIVLSETVCVCADGRLAQGPNPRPPPKRWALRGRDQPQRLLLHHRSPRNKHGT
jgi:hypothetical protein